MRRPLKVLFAEPPPERRVGGIETALSGLAAALPAAEVELVRTSCLDQPSVARADVVHFHGLWEPRHHRARTWCRKLGKPFIVSPHGMLEDWAFQHRSWKKWPYFHLVERRSVGRANAILATSEAEADTLRRWFSPEKIHVLSLGATAVPAPGHHAARQKLNLPDDEFVVLFLSRCHEKKGLHLLIEALPRIGRTTTRPIHLVVVGEGESRYVAPLRQATTSWAGNLHCTWAGAIWGDAKWDYLGAADLLCLPTFSENFGLVVVEALFAGTPVLTTFATPWPTLRGVLPVFLTPPRTDELVRALEARVQAATPGDGERSRTRATALAAFDWSVLAPRYLALYRQLADPSHPNAD
jgi:glycosyltransferase involved in cell wall biosynthesis